MKRGLWIGTAVVALAGVYPGVAWLTGKVIETRIGEYRARMLEQMPYLTVAERIYQRGILTSREEVTYQFGRRALERAGASPAGAAEPAAPAQRVRFTIRSRIEHGPFPGFGRPALAVIKSEFVTDEATQRAVARAFGEHQPIVFITRLGFEGGGVVTVSSPPFAGLDLGEGQRLSWSGLTATVEFGRNLAWFKMRGSAPGLVLDSPAGTPLRLADLTFESTTELAFGDLYVGGGSIRVGSMRIGVPAVGPAAAGAAALPTESTLDGLDYAARFERHGDFLDLTGKLAAARIEWGAFRLNDAHYEVSFRHLYGPSVAGLIRLLRNSFAEAPPPPAGDKTFEAQTRRLGIEILGHDPLLVIDKVSFATPEGDLRLSGSARIVGFVPADLEGAAGVESLARKLEARIDVSVAEGLLMARAAPAEDALPLTAIEQQLANLEAQGYVTRTAGRLITHVEFGNGQLTLNGKPFVPPSPPPPAPPAKAPRDVTHT